MQRDRTDWTDENMKLFTERKKKAGLSFVFHGSIRDYNALKGIISCPLHPNEKYSVLWSNFTREEAAANGGCESCSQYGTGRHSRTPMNEWVNKMGVHLSPAYKNQKTKCDWKCVSGAHTFSASYDTMNSVYQRAEIAGDDPIAVCPFCEIELIEATHSIEWVGDIAPTLSRQSMATWRCMACDGQFKKPLGSISRAIYPCTNLRCMR